MTQKSRNNLILVITGLGILLGVTLHRDYQLRQMKAGFADRSVIGQGKPVLLELAGEGCPACERMLPILGPMAKDSAEQFVIAYHDVWKDQAAGEKYGISAIPTLIFFDKDGQELFRHEGILSNAEILAKWKELGIDFPK